MNIAIQKEDLPIIKRWLTTLASSRNVAKKIELSSGISETQYNRVFATMEHYGSIAKWGFGDKDNKEGAKTALTENHKILGFYEHLYDEENKEKIKQKGAIYEAKMSVAQYYLFWPTAILGIIGGVYAVVQLILLLL